VFEELTRRNVAEHVAAEIGRPRWRDARVRVVEVGGRRAILKDVHDRHPLFRLLFGRYVVAREHRMYRLLRGIEGVPRPYRMLDKDGFLVEYVDGIFLSARKVTEGLQVEPAFYDRCADLIRQLHARGVAHLDLRNKKNFLYGEGGRAYVVDFASAVRVPRWLPFRRFWVRALGSADWSGLYKMKRRVSPELLTDEERRRLERFERTRSILFPPALLARWIRRRMRKRRKARAAKRRTPST